MLSLVGSSFLTRYPETRFIAIVSLSIGDPPFLESFGLLLTPVFELDSFGRTTLDRIRSARGAFDRSLPALFWSDSSGTKPAGRRQQILKPFSRSSIS